MKTVLITVDALRVDHLSQYGYHRDTLPVLDRMIDEGIKYEWAYANGPHTVQSIPSLFTSQYHVSNIQNEQTLPMMLSEAGVRTAGFHSNTALYYNCGRIPGFDDYEDYMEELDGRSEHVSLIDRMADKLRSNLDLALSEASSVRRWLSNTAEYLSDSSVISGHDISVYIDAEAITRDVVEWIKTNGCSDFFLWIHYMEPHRPYGVGRSNQEFSDWNGSDSGKKQLVAKANQYPDRITESERDRLIDLYDSDVRYLSDEIDRVISSLHSLDIWEETTVVLTSDHGEEFGDHGMFDHKNRPYEELIHVPLVINAANGAKHLFEQDSRSNGELRELVDLYPTICELHGVEIPDGRDGTRVFDETTEAVSATGSLRDDDSAIAHRTGRYKYIYLADGNDELFDVRDDPNERRSLIDERRETADELRGQLPQQLLDEVRTRNPEQYGDDAPMERLKELGYLE